MECIMSISPARIRQILVCTIISNAVLVTTAFLVYAATAFPHRAGFVQYARVDRPDDTFRTMLVDEASLVALRRGDTSDMTILMESYSDGEMSSIFVKRREGGRWNYGAIRLGETLDMFRPGPQCSSCHRAAQSADGMFTQALLRRFIASGEIARAYCDRSGRSPCPLDEYR
jgi:hypothetical protein